LEDAGEERQMNNNIPIGFQDHQDLQYRVTHLTKVNKRLKIKKQQAYSTGFMEALFLVGMFLGFMFLGYAIYTI